MTECRTLADFFGVDRVDFRLVDQADLLRRTALLVIDSQRDFVHPRKWGTEQSLQVAKELDSLVDEFRAAGVAPYWIYYKQKNLFGGWKSLRRAFGGYHGVKPKSGEPQIGKYAASAFADPACTLDDRLKADDKTHLLLAGFNTSACVQATAEHALERGYNVCIPDDMTENGAMPACASATLWSLERKGAIVADSASILSYIAKLQAA